MDRTFVEKALNAPGGSIVFRKPDLVLNPDSQQVSCIFEQAYGENVYSPEQLVVVADEATLVEQIKPGMLVLGNDLRVAVAGAFNGMAMKVDNTEMAVLWKTGQLWFRVPETVKITLENQLPEGITVKDLVAWIRDMLHESKVEGQVVEYHGSGVSTLTIADRAVLANASLKMGLICAVFPPDDLLADYFNEPAIRGIWADTEACYSRTIEVNMEEVLSEKREREGDIRLDEYDFRKSGNVWNYADLDHIACSQVFPEKLIHALTDQQTEEIKPYLFSGLDSHFSGEVRVGDMVLAGENFGNGVLNKQAINGLVAVGISVIIVKSVDWTFYRTAINHGLFILVCREVVDAYRSGDSLTIDYAQEKITLNEQEYALPAIDPEIFEIIRMKGILNRYISPE